MNLGSASVFLVAVSFVSPAVSTSYIDAQVANAAYVQPVAKTSYIDVRVQAEVTFPDVYSVEIITPTDLVSLATTKSFNEIVQFNDAQNFTFGKGISDFSTLSDSIVATLIFIRNFADTSTLLETYSSSLAKALEDSIGSVDTYVFSINKPVSDSLVLLDNMDGDIEYQLVKTTSDLLTANDSQIFDVLIVKSENATLNSNGILVMQDYCDITYFLEDYVGQSRTFT